ncbi:MAG: TolC family protein, partial [Woeseiaceae bacterium]
GDTSPEFGQAEAQLCSLPDLVPFEIAAERLEQNPDLLRFASEQQLNATRIQLADARRRPDWTLSAGIKQVEILNDQALVFSISVPLGSSSRAAPSSRRENALRQRSELEEQATRLDIHAALYDVYQELIHTHTALTIFDEEILPRASRIVADIEDGYRMGRFLQIELLNAQSELLAALAARLDVCNDNQRFLIEIERLTGGGPVWLAEPAGVTP